MSTFHYRSYGTFCIYSKRLHNFHGGFTHYRNYRAEIKASGVTYLTDAEIEGIQTAGDYKRLFKSLMDTYVKDFDSLIAQLPKVAQNTIAPQRDQMVTTIEQQYKALEDQFAAAGATDDTPIPAESRDTLISTLKSSRDMLKSTMESIYKQAQDLLNQ